MDQTAAIARCDQEISLALLTVLTGHDAVTHRPVHLADAMLYLYDWHTERKILTKTTMQHIPMPEPIDPQTALAALSTFWQHNPCSICGPGPACPHRADQLAAFEAFTHTIGSLNLSPSPVSPVRLAADF